MENPLFEFEVHTGLKVPECAKLLGIPKPTYYQYRRSGVMPEPVKRSVEAHMLLAGDVLKGLVEHRVYDDEL